MQHLFRILLLIGVASSAHAITAPAVTPAALCGVHIAWNLPSTRSDTAKTPLPISELKESRLYIASLSAFIAVPAPATSYDYIIAPGASTAPADAVAVTAVDSAGAESAGTAPVAFPVISCPKSRPVAPAGLTITTVK